MKKSDLELLDNPEYVKDLIARGFLSPDYKPEPPEVRWKRLHSQMMHMQRMKNEEDEKRRKRS